MKQKDCWQADKNKKEIHLKSGLDKPEPFRISGYNATHLLDKGIGYIYITPSTQHLNGKVERSHRIDEEEFYRMLEGVIV